MEYCVAFTIKSEYARFNKFSTATKALTYLIIHPLAARGLAAELLGLPKGNANKYTRDIKVGIRVLSPIQKAISANPTSQVEYLKACYYKLYILSNNKQKLEQLVNSLNIDNQAGISLGCPESLVEFDLVDITPVQILPPGKHSVSSIIPVNSIKLQWDEEGRDIHLENIPVIGRGKNEEFQQVLFRCDEKVLKGEVLEKLYQVGTENIYFF